jgi:glycosyltransferase involved in cell wall biosynthesis
MKVAAQSDFESVRLTMHADIIIPVYNEGLNIQSVLESFRRELAFPYRVLICYDFEEDSTLAALRPLTGEDYRYETVKNHGRGVFAAIQTGLSRTTAPLVFTFPADDDYNAPRLNAMMEKASEGFDIVCASRFMRGGCMRGCSLIKAFLVRAAAFLLYHFARIPTHDPTNGLRLFSRRVVESMPIESRVGWAFSLELLVKCHRLGWPIAELPAEWHERKAGRSRFRILRWLPQNLRWLFYGFATSWLRRRAETVLLRPMGGDLQHSTPSS